MIHLITTADIPKILGGFGLGVDYAERLSLQLTDKIDGAILSSAVEKTQQRYPYLSLRLRRTAVMYYCEDNPASVTLYHTDERACLNSESTHYHLWAVSYQEDYLYLDFYHGILDGIGIYRLLATLLYYYCAARYGISDHKGILTLEDPIRPEETTDPFDELTAAGSAPLHASKPVPAFLITQDGGLKRAQHSFVWDIELPEEEFVRFFTAVDGSPTTLVTILLARTLDKIFSDRKKEIVGTCMMNLRPMLKSETHHNCLGVIPFVFSDRVQRMPLDRQCTVHRGITFI